MITYKHPDTGYMCKCSLASSVPEGIPFKEVPSHERDEFNDAITDYADGLPVFDNIVKNGIFIGNATGMLQAHVDGLAQSWGYDDINSIAKYAARGNSPFNAEAVLLGDYADAVWVYGLGLIDVWQQGGPQPTLESIMSGLPAEPVKP